MILPAETPISFFDSSSTLRGEASKSREPYPELDLAQLLRWALAWTMALAGPVAALATTSSTGQIEAGNSISLAS